jgi:hypothetical protein
VALTRGVLALIAVALLVTPAAGQSIAAEVSQTVGVSSADNSAAATQARVFGETWSGLRFTAETIWGARYGTGDSDAFGAAYPYDRELKVMEAFADQIFRPGPGLVVVRAGRFRTPFGISSGSDHAYAGFLRAPLIRYDNYWAISNNFLEHGASVTAGIPQLFVQATAGVPADTGTARRRSGLDGVLRAQVTYRSLIIGASGVSSKPYMSPRFAHGRMEFAGVDARWMQGGVAVRGEWLAGRPFDGTTTTGGYVDLTVHRPALGPVTAVMRAERLDYTVDNPRAMHAVRYAAGARVRLLDTLSLQANVIRQRGIPNQGRSAFDLGATYVLRFDSTRFR